ncbi:MAG: restriction endonuclease subunit S [Defluviitaleaceae bacterium]|nr:restriction endonuclease subunit S [Defluviitaleaceae bacterium]MCL2273985.1 restriction endonuclease subunit S [Defluviitaleaceae bacterium]
MTAHQLKNSILQLAVQGKLVPQDPNDEPASALIERIRSEKARLVKEGRIKKEKPFPPIAEYEVPFDIPNGWVLCRIVDLFNFIDYRGATPLKTHSGIPFVTAKNVKDGYNDYSISEFISIESYEKRKSRGISRKGDILFTTEAPLGNVSIADLEEFSAGQRLITLQSYSDIVELNNDLFVYFLLSGFFKQQLKEKQTGTTVKGIKAEKLKGLLLPLPPLYEQNRIVTHIKQLLPYIAEYDATEKKLTALNKQFPDQLKKSILQAAVQGKLVEQDPHDEPASVLLKKIRIEKERLVKEGKIKKEKPLLPITEGDIPFDVPDSWAWVRLGALLIKLTDGAHHTPKYTESGVPFLSVKDISGGKINFTHTKFISPEEHATLCKRCNPEKGDILLTKVGTTGIPVLIDTDEEFSLFVSVALLKFNQDLLCAEYLVKLIESPLVGVQCTENTRGVGNKNWVMRDIANTMVVLPPLVEQRRIVTKCDELLAIAEQCKER